MALMMAIDDYESILETLDILSNPKLMKRLKTAEGDVKKGRVKALARIEKEIFVGSVYIYRYIKIGVGRYVIPVAVRIDNEL